MLGRPLTVVYAWLLSRSLGDRKGKGALLTTLAVDVVHARGVGKMIETPGRGWRARDTGGKWGWVFYRADGDVWESWEPDLPFGVAHVGTRRQAVQILGEWVSRLGDTPYWRLV